VIEWQLVRTVDRSAIVPFSAAAMFALVSEVGAYPEFLPWCSAANLQSASDSELVASLKIGYGAINSSFTTRNEFVRPQWMTMRLVEGPFSRLEGRWTFTPLGDTGCEIALQIEFDFASAVMDRLLGPVFETICNELISAFSQRAHALYDEPG
jgi:ribosome-associated toxin RatA of RatAB toxin-antitoxin module